MKTKTAPLAYFAALACAAFVGLEAHATLTLDASNDLGTIVPDAPSGDAQELGYVNTLLGLSLGGTAQVPGTGNGVNTITRSSEVDPGSKTATTQLKVDTGGPFTVPAGYEYVLAKYGAGGQDQANIAYVWYVGYQEALVPDSIGTSGGLSHVVGYNAVPEPSTYIAGALLLLPFAAGAVRAARRNRAE